MEDNFDLTCKPIPILVRKLAIPASIGFFFNTMFNVVDTYFGGSISTQALAALSLSFPIFFIVISMGSGISTGATALIATSLGAGNIKDAKMYAIQGVAFGIIVSVVLTFVGITVSPYLFTFLGASGTYLNQCLLYMNTIFMGSILFIVNYMLNSILNALGDTKSFRNFLIIAFFLNILLDPWFIYGGAGLPPMGIAGIALATLSVELIGVVYLSIRVSKTRLVCERCFSDIIPKAGAFKDIAYQGLPSSLNMVTVGLGIFVITYFVSLYGKDAVAAYGVATRIEQIVLLPTIGLNIAAVALVAQNNGAGLLERIFETISTALRYGALCMLCGTVFVFILARHLMGMFTSDEQVMEIGTVYLRIAAFILYAYVI
ncbi:MAG TPA: MATE family efflux transporter, partial [Deltaproteobacteria bacterium]|nr:MATE family efflux transporter [Deltaproteobacteria bacterium]